MPQKTSELHGREVINIRTGYRLGYVYDVLFDLESGRILSLVVPAPTKLFAFFKRKEDIVIPWSSVVCIGDDVVLVEIEQQL